MQNRLDRVNDIIFDGAPELNTGDEGLNLKSEKNNDKKIFNNLCFEIGVESFDDDIVEIKRVGKFKQSGDSLANTNTIKPRPVIVTLVAAMKERVLYLEMGTY